MPTLAHHPGNARHPAPPATAASGIAAGVAARSAPGPAAGLSAYGQASLAARIESASPHALVQMLYDRLLLFVRECRAAALANQPARRLRATARAIAIIDGLDATLDRARGGEVAESLHALYTLLSHRLLAGHPEALSEAEEATTAIATAWRTIR